jgi:carbonic anhydrase
MDAKAAPGQISALYAPIRPAVDQAGRDVDAAIRANARIQAGLLRSASPVIAERVSQGRLMVVPAVYDIVGGKVTLLS